VELETLRDEIGLIFTRLWAWFWEEMGMKTLILSSLQRMNKYNPSRYFDKPRADSSRGIQECLCAVFRFRFVCTQSAEIAIFGYLS